MASGKDKRRFKRYPLTSECFISFEEKSFRGSSTDYSLEGIGFSVDGSPPFVSGSNVRIRIEALDLDDEGIITWSRKSGNYVRGGCQKKSISGRLKNFPVADILIDLQRERKKRDTRSQQRACDEENIYQDRRYCLCDIEYSGRRSDRNRSESRENNVRPVPAIA